MSYERLYIEVLYCMIDIDGLDGLDGMDGLAFHKCVYYMYYKEYILP